MSPWVRGYVGTWELVSMESDATTLVENNVGEIAEEVVDDPVDLDDLDDGDSDVDDFPYLFSDDMIFMERMLTVADVARCPRVTPRRRGLCAWRGNPLRAR